MPGPWTSAGELADWTFCPRAHYYRSHPPAEGEDPRQAELRGEGAAFHRQYLTREVRRERFGSGWWAIALAGTILLLAAFVLARII